MFAIALMLWAICLLISSEISRGQQQIQLTKEFVDTLLQVLSPLCKNELESALGSALVDGISEVCKSEIQEIFMKHAPNDVFMGGPAESQQSAENPFAAPKPTSKKGRKQAPPLLNPVYSIAIFVAIFFTVIGGLAYYVHNTRSAQPSTKPKKLSKKKVRSVQPHAHIMLDYTLMLRQLKCSYFHTFISGRRRSSDRRLSNA
jgi:hypothetical protein